MQDLGALFDTLPDNSAESRNVGHYDNGPKKYASRTPIITADATPRNRGRYQTKKTSSPRNKGRYKPKTTPVNKPVNRDTSAHRKTSSSRQDVKVNKPYINIEDVTTPKDTVESQKKTDAAPPELEKIGIEDLGKSPLIVDPVLPILSPERFNLIMQAFNRMDRQQRDFCRMRYEEQFKVARKYFSDIVKIPEISEEDTLTQVHIKYEAMRKDLVRAKMITRYKTVITTIWTTLEFFMVNVIGININGFTDMQSSLMPFYSSYIVSMADAEIEKNGVAAKDDSGLLYFVLICVVHFVVFVGISFMCKNPETASKIYSSITGNIVNLVAENGEKVKPSGVGIKDLANVLGLGGIMS